MKVNWIIETTVLQKQKDELKSLIEENEDNLIEIKPFSFVSIDEKLETVYKSMPTIALCSLQVATDILKTRCYPGVYCNLNNFKCTQYYPHYSKYLLNNEYCMLPYGDLLNCKENLFKWLGNSNSLFIRPDSGFKEFTGQVVNYETFERDVKSLECFEPESNLLCLVAEPKNIRTEWRIVIANKQIVAYSQYKHEGKHNEVNGCPNAVIDFVKEVVKEVGWEPDLCYTMDVCALNNYDLKVIELNSFSCSGLYQCDLRSIIEEVREVVIEDWNDIYGT